MNAQPTRLMQLHLFYKNDLPEGFGVGLGEEFFSDHPEAQESFVRCSQMSIDFYGTLETDEARKALIADTQRQFNEACQWMNAHKGETLDEGWLTFFVILLDDMTFLQSIGQFCNDEFNGPMWTWLKDNGDVKEEIRC